MSSTESSTSNSQQRLDELVENDMDRRNGVRRLLQMVAVESHERTLETEDAAVKRQQDADHALIYGDGTVPATAGSDDVADKYMVAGNMSVTHTQQAAAPAKAMSLLTKGLLGASLLGGGAGFGVLINNLLKPAAAAGIDTDTITQLDFPELKK